MTTKTVFSAFEQDFWQALRQAIRNDDIEQANSLVANQMEAWLTQLQIEIDKLTHPGNTTLH